MAESVEHCVTFDLVGEFPQLHIPAYCSNCLAPSPSKKFKVKAEYYVDERDITRSIEIPLCSSCQHLYHPLGNFGILLLAFFLAVFFALVLEIVALQLSARTSFELFLFLIPIGLVLGATVALSMDGLIARNRGFPPVRMEVVDKEPSPSVTISFNNEQYAELFRKENLD